MTVGVLSDSVNQYDGGLADSYETGDLNAEQPGQRDRRTARPAATDEGRAMLENIHDIAPGASLAFATGDRQRARHSPTTSTPWPPRPTPNIIVDDVGYADEPMFQDGLIAQAVDTVTARGRDLLQRRRQRGPTPATCRPSAATAHDHRASAPARS